MLSLGWWRRGGCRRLRRWRNDLNSSSVSVWDLSLMARLSTHLDGLCQYSIHHITRFILSSQSFTLYRVQSVTVNLLCLSTLGDEKQYYVAVPHCLARIFYYGASFCIISLSVLSTVLPNQKIEQFFTAIQPRFCFCVSLVLLALCTFFLWSSCLLLLKLFLVLHLACGCVLLTGVWRKAAASRLSTRTHTGRCELNPAFPVSSFHSSGHLSCYCWLLVIMMVLPLQREGLYLCLGLLICLWVGSISGYLVDEFM